MTDTAVVKTGTPLEEPVLKLSRQPGYHDMMALARTLLDTGFLPQAIKTPGQALAIILTGQEMKLGPMQSLRSISVINGKPVLAADLQLALFHRDGGTSKWEKLTDTEAVLWLKHANGVEHTQSFTMEMAEQAGLDKNPGGTYQKYPQAMLRSRAITWGLKSVGFEPVTGCYDPDELAGLVPTAQDLAEKPKALQQPEPPAPWDEKPKAADGKTWPFKGPKQGTPISEFTRPELLTAHAWIVKTGRGKELLEAIETILAARGGE